jgi:hypothetical protein
MRAILYTNTLAPAVRSTCTYIKRNPVHTNFALPSVLRRHRNSSTSSTQSSDSLSSSSPSTNIILSQKRVGKLWSGSTSPRQVWQLTTANGTEGNKIWKISEIVVASSTTHGGEGGTTTLHPPSSTSTSALQGFLKRAIAYLLPSGYPLTVDQSYAGYATWSSLAMMFSSVGGVLATQSLLYAVGVGSGSIPLAAAMNWVLKDGLGTDRWCSICCTSRESL